MLKFILGFLFVFQACAAAKPDAKSTCVVFYNVENLFDTQSTKGKSDYEFSPGSAKKWDQKKYDKKLADISKVLSSIGSGSYSGIIGLSEVENRQVLVDLIAQKELVAGSYSIVHQDSHDRRGIDVALLYRNNLFRELSSRKIPIGETARAKASSREILYVKLLGEANDTLHVFVNHWHSRSEGQKKSEPARILAAKTLRLQIDAVNRSSRNAKIIVMGDMNDEPDNISLHDYLGAVQPMKNADPTQLYNLLYNADKNGFGTVYYSGEMLMLDNLIVSGTMLSGANGWRVIPESATVFHQPWMEYRNNRGKISPNRTYVGNKYTGGVSDHFPVYFEMKRE